MEIVNSPNLQKDKLLETQKKIDTAVLIFKEKLAPKNLQAMGLESAPQNLSNDFQKVNGRGQVQLYIKYTEEPFVNQLLQDILFAGGKIDLISKEMGLIQCWLPSDKVEEISEKSYVRRISMPDYAILKQALRNKFSIKEKILEPTKKNNPIKTLQQGSVDSSADTISQADKVRLAGVTGKGIKVGIISDGINGIALSQASGDIPATYEAFSITAHRTLNDGAEGLALMEIVHDIAPDAQLAFSNYGTSAETIKIIQLLDTTFNCDIIADDVFFYEEPFFEDGPLARQIKNFVDKNKIYITSAGNDAHDTSITGSTVYEGGGFYEGDFSGMSESGLIVHNFDGKGTDHIPMTLFANSSVRVTLQWNDKFGSSNNDYDLWALDANGNIITKSENIQNGSGYPIEYFSIKNGTNSDLEVAIVIIKKPGAADCNLKLDCGGYSAIFTKFDASAGSIMEHASSKDVFTAGAVDFDTPQEIYAFSSQGPARIDYPYLEFRSKPDICGVDGIPVTGNGGFNHGFFNGKFFGTSAAAPHIAGLAALLWSANKSLSANTIKSLLKGTAVDLGTAEADTIFGFGRANVFNAYTALANNKTLSATIEAGIPNIMIYPNPIKLSGFSNSIIFDKLKGDETIRLFTVAGELVTSYSAAAGNTSWTWDLRNSAGNLAASGIYVYLITNGSGQKRIGKLAVMN